MISVIVEEDGNVRRLDLDSLPVVIGRDDGVGIPVQSTRASRQHARIEVGAEGYVVVDLGSSNGTLRNGDRIERAVLARGDHLKVGDADITFLGGEDPAKALLPRLPGIEVGDLLAEGTTSRVFSGRQTGLGRDVVVKILRPEWKDHPAASTTFVRNARAQSKLHLAGLASGYDVVTTEGVACFVLERLPGVTLGARVRARLALEPEAVLGILRTLCDLAAELHRQGQTLGWLHPERILIDDSGTVRVGAIGFPLLGFDGFPESRARELAYLAPEQAASPAAATPKGDVFAIGALAAFLLAGRPPRSAEGVAAMVTALGAPLDLEVFAGRRPLPPAFRALLLRLVAEDAALRPSASEAAAALREVADSWASLASVAVDPAREGAPPPPRQRSRRFRLLSLAITGVLFLALHGGLVLVWKSCGSKDGGASDDAAVEPGAMPDPSAILDALGGPKPAPPEESRDEDAASAAFAALEVETATLLAQDHFTEAIGAVEAFARRYGKTTRGEAAVKRLASIQAARVAKAEGLLGAAEAAVGAGGLEAARSAVAAARPHAAAILAERLQAVEAGLEELERKAREAAPPPGPPEMRPKPDRPKPGPPPSAPKAGDLGAEVAARFGAPLALPELTALLKRLGDAPPEAFSAREIRLLNALEVGLLDLLEALRNAHGTETTLRLVDGTTLRGVIEKEGEAGFAVVSAGKRVPMPLDRLSPAEASRILGTLPPTLDRYLARAVLDLAAGADSEAWFDLHGARLLAGDDTLAREALDGRLAELVRRMEPGTGR